MVNIQSMLHTTLDLCKNASLAVLFGSNGNSYAFYTQVCVCVCIYIYIYTYSSQYRDAGLAKEIKIIGTALYAVCQGNLAMCHFVHACHRFVSPGIDHFTHGIILKRVFVTFYFNNYFLIKHL